MIRALPLTLLLLAAGTTAALATPPAAVSMDATQFMKMIRHQARLAETASGLCFRLLAPGTGARPRPQDTVVLGMKCMRADTMEVIPQMTTDPITVKVSDLLPGLQEGVQMMTLESQIIFVLPPQLSFGDHSWPASVPRGMPLAFVLVLHDITTPESP